MINDYLTMDLMLMMMMMMMMMMNHATNEKKNGGKFQLLIFAIFEFRAFERLMQ